jgi:hypothetical protein
MDMQPVLGGQPDWRNFSTISVIVLRQRHGDTDEGEN